MPDTYRTQSAAEYGDTRPEEQVTMLDFSGDFLRQAQQSEDSSDGGTERHGSLEPDDSRVVTGATGGGGIGTPGGADQQEGGERWGGEISGAGQASQTEPGVPQEGRPFTASEAAGQSGQQQGQPGQQQASQNSGSEAGTGQVEFDAENAGAGQEIEFDSDPSLTSQIEQEQGSERQASQGQGSGTTATQATQFDPSALGQQGGGEQGGGFETQIREHMEVIGADGVHLGTVDAIEGRRIKLTKADSGAGFEGGSHQGHHHYISCGLVAGVEGDQVRLSATAANAYAMEEEE